MDCFTDFVPDGGIIKFDRFMADYEVEALGGIDVTNLYGHAEYLDLLFAHFDTTQAGYITQEEWVVGCEWLNKRLPESHQIKEPLQVISDVTCTMHLEFVLCYRCFI